MVMVPVATVQVGWVLTLTVGAAGVTGCAFMVTLVAALVHPLAFLAVRE
jgi:hypothetical protein